MKKTVVILVLLVAVLLAGCDKDKPRRVKGGQLRDTIFSVEVTYNGCTRVWMTHDDIAGYCTCDAELGARARDLMLEHSGEVLMTFKAIEKNDPEYTGWDKSDCGSIKTGEDSYTPMFLMQDIRAFGN